MEKKHIISLAALSLFGMTNVADAATANNADACAPTQPVCYSESCECTYCLGPEHVNPSVRPRTCNGDLSITLAGFYWNAHQDGMEFAVENNIYVPDGSGRATTEDIQQLNNLIDARYHNPHFDWDFGFKFGIGYNTTHDGWDVTALWTWYQGKAHDDVEAELDDNHALIPLWSAFSPAAGSITYAREIDSDWKLQMNLIDIELGREFWTSKYLSLRPHVGVRIASLKQKWNEEFKGGSWAEYIEEDVFQDNYNGFAVLHNDFWGVGIRAGLDSVWNLGCGWAIYGNLAASVLYGNFHVDHNEWVREASYPHNKIKVLETHEDFRAARPAFDLGIGVQWLTLFCDGDYAFTARLGWEQHIFFNQNQMWGVVRIGDVPDDSEFPNNTGENVFHQRRGDLDTQGWTLTFVFEF